MCKPEEPGFINPQMEFIMKKTINAAARSVTFTFDGLDSVTIHVSKVSAENATYAMLHGFAARIGDNAAIQKSAENNFTVTEAMRRGEVEKMVTFYEDAGNKDWNVRVASGQKAAPLSPVILAIATKRNCTYEEAQVWVTARMMAELEAM
jgi:endo-1,4-beta-D-glucanase Y